jgi:3-oxoadipate enol-lactonase
MTADPAQPLLGFDDMGAGVRTVIVLHDWISDTSSWAMVRPLLDAEWVRWIFVDLRGYGRSIDIAGDFTIAEAATDIIRLADALAIGRFAIVGHSMSCLVAVHLAQHCPDRIERLVAFTPPPLAGFDDSMFAHLAGMALSDDNARAAMMRDMWGEHLSDSWVAFKARRWRATAAPQAAATYVAMFTRDGLADPEARVAAPAMLVTGDQDAEIMRAASATPQFAAIAADLATHAMPCGHYPMQEMPPLTATLLNGFLAGA